jgi:hypothetical protein
VAVKVFPKVKIKITIPCQRVKIKKALFISDQPTDFKTKEKRKIPIKREKRKSQNFFMIFLL